MAGKYSINLLQAELLPKKVLVTLPRIVVLWLVTLVLMIAWAVMVNAQSQNLNGKNKILQTENKRQTAIKQELERELVNRRVDAVLEEKLATIKMLLLHKSALHSKLTDTNLTFVSGFAMAMEELSDLHHNDVRLQHIIISNDDMSFSGIAKSPESVPAWLSGFQHSTLLAGKAFIHFKLEKNDADMTEFTVSSSALTGAEK
jgi:Tfp pilus assembly protein PilN